MFSTIVSVRGTVKLLLVSRVEYVASPSSSASGRVVTKLLYGVVGSSQGEEIVRIALFCSQNTRELPTTQPLT